MASKRPSANQEYFLFSFPKIIFIAKKVAPATEKFKRLSGTTKNPPEKKKKGDPLPSFREDSIRLNKFLSNAGVCSRREADVLIQTGVIKINGEVITELGYKIKPTDKVQYDGETIKGQTKRYVLLNKPKGFTTNIDSNSKKTQRNRRCDCNYLCADLCNRIKTSTKTWLC